jgi:hypothetical protein
VASGEGELNSPYTFRLDFDLMGIDPSKAVLAGKWGVDNIGSIRLNGSNATGHGGALVISGGDSNFETFHPFIINDGFVPGTNTLEFVVTNVSAIAALNVTDLQFVPEPSTLLLVGIGAFVICVRRAYLFSTREGPP